MKAEQLAVQPEDTQKVFREVAERSARILNEFAQRQVTSSISAAVTDELGIAKAYMDSRVQTIYGGTTEIMKEIIGRGLNL